MKLRMTKINGILWKRLGWSSMWVDKAVRDMVVERRGYKIWHKLKAAKDRNNYNEKSTQRRHKHCTAHAGCSKVQPKFFALPQTPFPGVWDGQYLISWRLSLPLPTNPVWWGSMHAISSYRGNRPTNTPTNTQTQTEPITIHCATVSSAHSVKNQYEMQAIALHWHRKEHC